MPEHFFENMWGKIKKNWKIAFFSAIIIGFFTHMYVFTNMLPNHDGLTNIYNTQLKFKSGRFFLGPFSGISSFFDLPWVIGTLSILYLAIMTVLLTELFELRKKVSIILTAGLVVTFPTVAATFSYMFTADGYMMGNLLAVLAVLITKKYKYGFVIGSLVFYLSVGIYQANLTLLLTIIAIWLIRELLFNTLTVKSFFLYFLRFIGMTGIGMTLYTITFKGYERFFGGQITDYQGLDSIGQNTGGVISQLVRIKDFATEFFFRGFVKFAPVNLYEILNVALVVIVLALIVTLIIKNKVYKEPLKVVFILFGVCLLPVLAFSLYFVSPGVFYHMLMVMSLVSIYLLPVIIYDKIDFSSKLFNIQSWAVVVVTFFIIFNFAIIANISYFNMTLKYERSYATVNRMLDRMEQTEGYEEATKLAIVGRLPMRTEISSNTVPYSIPPMIGATGENFLLGQHQYRYMLENYFGAAFVVVTPEELESIKESKDFQQMGAWPASDSIQIVGDTIILKLSE